jgi:transducin (beta)-like 1
MSLTSEELNFLIYRYLRECGFEHSAFTFGHESFIYKSSLDGSGVPPGWLIALVQKGLQYSELEAHVTLDGQELVCDEPVHALKTHQCRPKHKRRIFDPYEPLDSDYGPLEIDQAIPLHEENHEKFATQLAFHGGVGTACKLAIGYSDGNLRVLEFKDKIEEQKTKKNQTQGKFFTELWKQGEEKVKTENNEENASTKRRKVELSPNESTNMHAITSLAWNPSGSEVVTGHYNGTVNLWNLKGECLSAFSRHTGPVAGLKFSKSGKFLLSASVDGSVNLLSSSLVLIKRFLAHSGPVLDLDWNPNEKSFVSSGTDGNIFLCQNSEEDSEPVKFQNPHVGDCNSVRFDSSGSFVASGGDDKSVRIYNANSGVIIHTFKDHLRAVLNVRWSVDSEKYSTQPVMLVSSSADSSVNLYSINSSTASLMFTLAKHAHPVTSVEFQPGNALLVSASHDRVHLWSTADGTLVKSFRSEGDGGINSLAWDSVGRRIAVAYSDGPAYILDLQI